MMLPSGNKITRRTRNREYNSQSDKRVTVALCGANNIQRIINNHTRVKIEKFYRLKI